MRIAILLALFTITLFSCTGDKSEEEAKVKPSPAEMPDASLFAADVELENQVGETISWSSYYGKPSIVSMIFTNCDYACPLIVEDLKNIDKGLKPDIKEDVQYLLISFDVERDLPDTLKEFHEVKSLDKRWHLLHGDDSEVRLLSNLLEIKYKRDQFGNFSHGNTIVVLNAEGVPIARSDKLGKGESELKDVLNRL